MVRALLPRATRSGLTETKPAVTRTPGRWGKSKRLEAGGPARRGVQGLQSVGAPLGCNKGLTLRGEEEGAAHGEAQEGRRTGLPVQGEPNERTGQGTTAYGQFAEGAVRYDVARVGAGAGAGAGRHWSGKKVVYRLEKTEKLMVMSQCLSVPFEDRGDGGEREEKKATQEAGETQTEL